MRLQRFSPLRPVGKLASFGADAARAAQPAVAAAGDLATEAAGDLLGELGAGAGSAVSSLIGGALDMIPGGQVLGVPVQTIGTMASQIAPRVGAQIAKAAPKILGRAAYSLGTNLAADAGNMLDNGFTAPGQSERAMTALSGANSPIRGAASDAIRNLAMGTDGGGAYAPGSTVKDIAPMGGPPPLNHEPADPMADKLEDAAPGQPPGDAAEDAGSPSRMDLGSPMEGKSFRRSAIRGLRSGPPQADTEMDDGPLSGKKRKQFFGTMVR